MKRLFWSCCLLALAACAKDSTQIAPEGGSGAVIVGAPVGAAKGYISVKLSEQGARQVAAAQGTMRGAATRSGLAGIDEVLAQVGAEGFERVVAYDPEWEVLYDQTGMNLWYNVTFGDDVSSESVAKQLAALSEIQVVEYPFDPMLRRPMCEGPARPAMDGDLPVHPNTRAAGAMNDPMLPQQWHFDNPGPSDRVRTPKAGADIDLLDAWSLCAGSSQVIVAVIDEPVQFTHPDLQDNIWTNPDNASEHGYNFFNDKPELDWVSSVYENGYGWVYTDHGTHVAGTIAAMNNNARGVCGIAGGRSGNGVRIMSCQNLGNDRSQVGKNIDVRAFEYAWKNGAVIAQNSWGYGYSAEVTPEVIEAWWNNPALSQFSMLRDAIRTFIKGAGSKDPSSPLKGGLVFFAAGNDGDTYQDVRIFPAAFEPVIAVGAMAWDFRPAYYTDYGTWVDISAPGGDYYSSAEHFGGFSEYSDASLVLSTILCDDAIDYKDGRKKSPMYGYGWMQGTSMACPHVSGVAALGLSYAAQLGKQFTPDQFKSLLLTSVGGVDSYFSGSIFTGNRVIPDAAVYKGKMGGGCVDALKLLLAIKGTPALYVKTGDTTTVDLAPYFGGEASSVTLQSAMMDKPAAIGLPAIPVFEGTKMKFNPSKPGVAVLTVVVRAGDTTLTREFAVVSRAGLASNGGWL